MKKLLLLIALLVTAAFFYYCVTTHSPEMQRDINGRVKAAIDGRDFANPITVKTDGRDVILNGVVASQFEKEQAGNAAHDIYGVRTVANNLLIREPKPEPAPEPVVEFQPEPIQMPAPTIIEQPALIEQPVEIVEEIVEEPVQFVEEVIEVIEQPAAVNECQSRISSLVEGRRVNFATGSANITSSSLPMLNEIVNAMGNCSNIALHVHGHTDSSGNYEANRKLSHARAKSVGLYILSKGVSQEVRVFGHGPDQPVASNDTPEGRAENRRIEFKISTPRN